MYYRKKPVIVQAFQFVACAFEDLPPWIRKSQSLLLSENEQGIIYEIEIPNRGFIMRARSGDWIIFGAKGEIYPCKPYEFAATYEKVDIADGEAANASEGKEKRQ